jgi:hypothetical protein
MIWAPFSFCCFRNESSRTFPGKSIQIEISPLRIQEEHPNGDLCITHPGRASKRRSLHYASGKSIQTEISPMRIPRAKQLLPRAGAVPLRFPGFPVEIRGNLWCQPRTLVRGSGLSSPRNCLGINLQGFSPGGGASNSILADADDQANNSGLSLKPALTGFSQM